MKILLVDFGMPITLEQDQTLPNKGLVATPYIEPVGGSETSIYLLAKGLSELGHSVILLNTSSNQVQDNNLIISNISNFMDAASQADIILCNRNIPNEIMNFLGRTPVYYWAHDAYDQQTVKWMMNRGAWTNPITKILCVSAWQANTFNRYLNVDTKYLGVLPNPIDISLGMGHEKRNPNKLIFCSIPYKGLSKLAEIFKRIRYQTQNSDLELHVFSSFDLYGRPQENQSLTAIYSELASIKNVFINKPVSMKKLAYEFATSSFMIHPSTYHETFGRVFIEAFLGGCLPITLDNGANKEVIKEYGYVLPYKNILNNDTMNEYVDFIVDLLSKDESYFYKMRINAYDYAKQYDYVKIASKFISMMNKS